VTATVTPFPVQPAHSEAAEYARLGREVEQIVRAFPEHRRAEIARKVLRQAVVVAAQQNPEDPVVGQIRVLAWDVQP